jgi:hypothetical protein
MIVGVSKIQQNESQMDVNNVLNLYPYIFEKLQWGA